MKRFLLCCGFSSLLVSISGCGQEDAGIIDGSRAVQIEGTAELCNDIINKKLPQNYLCQDWRNIGNPDMQKAVMTINGYTKILQSGKSIDNVSQADARKLVSDADESNSQDNSNKSQFSINNVIAGFLSPFTPKVQRQVTVLESVGTERCYSVSNLCYDWELGPQLNPYSLCLASPDLDAISKSDFTALLEKGSTIVGNPTELEKLKTRVTVNGQKDWKTNCNVRKYIMEGKTSTFD